ncbi:MAG: GTP 3',8-cyclase MoaA [Armatimonadetes bacterium]|nr:GTP 3',8-cyclase MoaA [Armatimonadota bacterium]
MNEKELDILTKVNSDTQVWRPLEDKFGRRHTYLRVSLTDRCNFRCVYCMPTVEMEWIPRSEVLTLEEVVRLVKVFARLGIDKVRLTGGEPTVRKGLTDLIRDIKGVPGIKSLHMTTNGSTLAARAGEYRGAGLDGLNVSMDSLRPERFSEITRGAKIEPVLEGLAAARQAGFETLKVNVVVINGVNDDEIIDFVDYAAATQSHVRFIEFMPFLGNGWNRDHVLPYAEMKRRIAERRDLLPIETEPSAVAKEFAIGDSGGTVGFVTSVTDDFCRTCNRVRLTAEGRLKTCLFLAAKESLRDAMRAGASDEDLAESIHVGLQGKWAGHPSMEKWIGSDDKAMVQIGG